MKNGNRIILINVIIATYFLMSFLIAIPLLDMSYVSAKIKKDDRAYSLQRSLDYASYSLDVEGVINHYYSTNYLIRNSNLFISKDSDNSTVVQADEIPILSFLGPDKEVYYLQQEEDKLTVTKSIKNISINGYKKDYSFFNGIYNFLRHSDKLSMKDKCSKEDCTKVVKEVQDDFDFTKTGDNKVKLDYSQTYTFQKEASSQNNIKIVQNLYIPDGFLVEVEGRKYNIWNDQNYDNYKIKTAEESDFHDLKSTDFDNYIVRNNGKELVDLKDAKAVIKKTNNLDSVTFSKPNKIRLISPDGKYSILLDLNLDQLEEVRLDTFSNKLLIKSSGCDQEVCTRGFSLIFD